MEQMCERDRDNRIRMRMISSLPARGLKKDYLHAGTAVLTECKWADPVCVSAYSLVVFESVYDLVLSTF